MMQLLVWGVKRSYSQIVTESVRAKGEMCDQGSNEQCPGVFL